jgi:hypothetical protein
VGITLSIIIDDHVFIYNLDLTADEQMDKLKDPWYEKMHSYAAFLREVGFASFIALIIIVLVEISNRREQVETTKVMLKEISNSVFNAVLGVSMPRSVVKQAIGIIQWPIVRDNLRLEFRLEHCSDDEVAESWKDKCVLLHLHSTYELTNLTGSSVDYPIKVTSSP